MTTTTYRSPLGDGCSSIFSSRHYSAVQSRLGARGTMTNLSYRVRAAELVMNKKQEHSVLLHVESWQRHPTVEERRRVFVPFFRRRHYSAVRSRLGARGTMTTTCYRVRAAVGVRQIFPSRHYSVVRLRLGARGKR
ncbi:hypothetical protein TNCV_1065011 [Trichonephila clavipes]|nr:hypothetical protein TNCV_1065011 [Trichonephila clavipes]